MVQMQIGPVDGVRGANNTTAYILVYTRTRTAKTSRDKVAAINNIHFHRTKAADAVFNLENKAVSLDGALIIYY